QTFLSASELDLLTGLFKAGVFGAIIGALPCYLGMNVRGGASGVGAATTNTVVFSIVALVCVDLLFTFVFYMLEL
ncbi:MAG: ABC transporter permease, partial [Planctomycetota bacterium]